MADLISQCDSIKSPRLRQICRGETDLLPWKVNEYRRLQGLPPLYPNDVLMVSDSKNSAVASEIPKNTAELVLEGPGTEFAGLTTMLGIKMSDNCACKAMMFKMNDIYAKEGAAAYREQAEKIISFIQENMNKWGWSATTKAWASAGWNYMLHPELWKRVKPTDPIPGLFWYSLELYESKPR